MLNGCDFGDVHQYNGCGQAHQVAKLVFSLTETNPARRNVLTANSQTISNDISPFGRLHHIRLRGHIFQTEAWPNQICCQRIFHSCDTALVTGLWPNYATGQKCNAQRPYSVWQQLTRRPRGRPIGPVYRPPKSFQTVCELHAF